MEPFGEKCGGNLGHGYEVAYNTIHCNSIVRGEILLAAILQIMTVGLVAPGELLASRKLTTSMAADCRQKHNIVITCTQF